MPVPLRESVAGFGRILSYSPYHSKRPAIMPMDVPNHSLPPDSLRATYNDQADLDMYTETFGLPKLVPEVVGETAAQRTGEATMDLQVAHAIAPDARKVLVNARPTVEGGGTYVKIAELMEA